MSAFKGTKNDVTRQAKFVGDYYSSKTTPKKILAFKGTKKNDVMRQAGILGDSYSSKTTPFKYVTIHITFVSLFGKCFVQVRN